MAKFIPVSIDAFLVGVFVYLSIISSFHDAGFTVFIGITLAWFYFTFL